MEKGYYNMNYSIPMGGMTAVAIHNKNGKGLLHNHETTPQASS